MIKVKTFKVGDESIDTFLEGVTIMNNGIQTHDDNITFVYTESKYQEFGDEEVLASLYQSLFTEKKHLLSNQVELKMFERREKGEHYGRDLEALKSAKVKTEIAIEDYGGYD